MVDTVSITGLPANKPNRSLAEIVKEYMDDHKLVTRTFGARAQLTSPVISSVLNGTCKVPSPKIIAHLSLALSIDPDDLIWRVMYFHAIHVSALYKPTTENNFFGANCKDMLAMVLRNSLKDDLSGELMDIVRKNYWRNAPTIVTDYDDDFMYAISLMSKERYQEYVEPLIHADGIIPLEKFLKGHHLRKWKTIPDKVAVVMAELGIGTIFSLLVIYMRNEVARYMRNHTDILYKIKYEM